MPEASIEATVAALQADTVAGEENAWEKLRPLGVAVVPYLLRAYPAFRKYQGRVSLVFHATRYARESDDAFRLGLAALDDRSTLVRYRACALLAYSLRKDALEPLRRLLTHADTRTIDDARAAIDAIENQNHHLFHDRAHSGRVRWEVDNSDREA